MGDEERSHPPFAWRRPVLRILCPACHFAFLQLTPPEEGEVICPRCGTRFKPVEEEIVDPEDD